MKPVKSYLFALAVGFSFSHMAFSQDVNTLAEQSLVTKVTGKLDFGMTDAPFLGQSSLYHPVSSPNAECYMLAVNGNDGLRLMVINHILARAAVRKPGISDQHGIQVGDDKARLVSQFGKEIVFSPHKYEDDAQYADVFGKGAFGMRYELKHDKITAIFAGTKDAVILVEDCN